MLPRKSRLARADFPALLQSRTFFHSPHFVLRYSGESKIPQAAVSVSKKVAKSAVKRNLIRRRAYSLLQNKLLKGKYLFIAKTGADKVRGLNLGEELNQLLKSAERSYNR